MFAQSQFYVGLFTSEKSTICGLCQINRTYTTDYRNIIWYERMTLMIAIHYRVEFKCKTAMQGAASRHTSHLTNATVYRVKDQLTLLRYGTRTQVRPHPAPRCHPIPSSCAEAKKMKSLTLHSHG